MSLTSHDKKDYILRLIEQMGRMVAALLHKLRDGEESREALANARVTLSQMLGPLGDIAPRMDSVTAGQMVGDPDVLGAWAELTAAEAEVASAHGDIDAAGSSRRRALELAIEAHLRTPSDRPELLALIERLRPAVAGQALAPRHEEALAALDERA